MASSSEIRQTWLTAAGIALRNIILFLAVLTVPLAAAQELGLTESQTTSWIAISYGLPSLISLLLALIYRQPMIFTGNLFALIFVASLGSEFSYGEIVGGYLVAGLGVLIISLLGLTRRLASLLPAPIVFGLLAGALLPFIARIFTFLGEEPLLVGGIFLTYLLSQRFLGSRVPAILPAVIVGLIVAAFTGQLGGIPGGSLFIAPEITAPVFSLTAIVTISPVVLILIVLQSNLPSLVFLRNQGFHPPERMIDMISGLGTILGSFLGPTAVSLSLPANSLVAGPEAGQRQFRYYSVILVAIAGTLTALLSRFAALVPEIFPETLLLTLAGLAVVGVMVNALKRVAEGPLILGPVFAFAVASSQIVWLGFGPFFWALVIGVAVSLLLEREKMMELQAEAV